MSSVVSFITRNMNNVLYAVVSRRLLKQRKCDGFTIIDDAEVRLASKGNAKLAIPMRRVRVKRHNGAILTFLTNDLTRPAVEIAGLYKMRWQIELLFRWIKQHLKIRKFLGRSENAVRLQLIATMIAYLLLKLADCDSRTTMPPISFTE